MTPAPTVFRWRWTRKLRLGWNYDVSMIEIAAETGLDAAGRAEWLDITPLYDRPAETPFYEPVAGRFAALEALMDEAKP